MYVVNSSPHLILNPNINQIYNNIANAKHAYIKRKKKKAYHQKRQETFDRSPPIKKIIIMLTDAKKLAILGKSQPNFVSNRSSQTTGLLRTAMTKIKNATNLFSQMKISDKNTLKTKYNSIFNFLGMANNIKIKKIVTLVLKQTVKIPDRHPNKLNVQRQIANQIELLEKKLAQEKITNIQLKQQILYITNTNEENQKKHEHRVMLLQQNIKQCDDVNSKLHKKLNDLKSQKTTLPPEYTKTLNAQLAKSKQQIEQCLSEKKRLNQIIDESLRSKELLQQRYDTLQNISNNNIMKYTQLYNINKQLNTDIGNEKRTVQLYKDRLINAQTMNTRLGTEIDNLKQEKEKLIIDFEDDYVKLKQKNKEINGYYTQCNNSKNKLKQQYDNLNKQFQNYKHKSEALSTKLKSQNNKLNEMLKKYDDGHDKIVQKLEDLRSTNMIMSWKNKLQKHVIDTLKMRSKLSPDELSQIVDDLSKTYGTVSSPQN